MQYIKRILIVVTVLFAGIAICDVGNTNVLNKSKKSQKIEITVHQFAKIGDFSSASSKMNRFDFNLFIKKNISVIKLRKMISKKLKRIINRKYMSNLYFSLHKKTISGYKDISSGLKLSEYNIIDGDTIYVYQKADNDDQFDATNDAVFEDIHPELRSKHI